MSRPIRLEYAGALYHVTSRGNERKPIFLEDADFELFLEVLSEVCDRYNWVIHSWCLIKNCVRPPAKEVVAKVLKLRNQRSTVISAKAEIHCSWWVPACAGTTVLR